MKDLRVSTGPGSLLNYKPQNIAVSDKPKPNFLEILNNIDREYVGLKNQTNNLGGKSSKELLNLQVKVNELNLSVECVSKVADGMLAVTRRLQGN